MTDNIPKTMHAVILTGHGGLDKLEFHRDWPVPEPQSDEVLIRVLTSVLFRPHAATRISTSSDCGLGTGQSR